MYDDGILVNGPVVMSTTLTFATLGISILGVLLQVLAGILLLRGGRVPCQGERAAGLGGCVPHCGHRFSGFWRVPDCFTDPRFPFCFCDLNAVLPRKHSARQSRKPPVCKGPAHPTWYRPLPRLRKE